MSTTYIGRLLSEELFALIRKIPVMESNGPDLHLNVTRWEPQRGKLTLVVTHDEPNFPPFERHFTITVKEDTKA